MSFDQAQNSSLPAAHSGPYAQSLPGYGQALQFALYTDRVCTHGRLAPRLLATREVAQQGSRPWWTAAARAPGAPALCQNFDSLFSAFQRARFAPDLSESAGYVVALSLEAQLSEVPSPSLPTYSAQGFLIPSREECASYQAEPLLRAAPYGKRACLRIRLGEDEPRPPSR